MSGLNWHICLIYLDDIIVRGDSFESMSENVDKALFKLHEAGLKLKPRKCKLFCKEVEYLGHIISADGVKTDPEKTEAIRDWPIPKTVTDGLCSYYWRFIKNYSEIAKPLHRLTEKGQIFEWSESCEVATN